MRKIKTSINWEATIGIAVVLVAVMCLWGTPVVTPLKIFVVLLHELSHALATLLTGGRVSHIEISPQIGGSCHSSGGNRFVITSAGYVGSMVWGSLIMLSATRARRVRAISIVLGIVIGVITLVYVRTIFGVGFGIVFCAAMLAAGWKLEQDWNRLILQAIGGTSILYAPLDIFSDVIARRGIGSDADALAELTGVPSVLWGLIWIALSLLVAATALWLSVLRRAEPASALKKIRRS